MQENILDEHFLSPEEIADFPPPTEEDMTEGVIEQRLRNLHCMDYAVKKCEYRKHIVNYEPFIAHILHGGWQNKPPVDARENVPYSFIDKYAEWGVQIIELHHDVWSQFGRLEPINETIFTHFVDYCHKKGIKVYVYIILGQTSLTAPPLSVDSYALPQWSIRPPDTYGREKASAKV